MYLNMPLLMNDLYATLFTYFYQLSFAESMTYLIFLHARQVIKSYFYTSTMYIFSAKHILLIQYRLLLWVATRYEFENPK